MTTTPPPATVGDMATHVHSMRELLEQVVQIAGRHIAANTELLNRMDGVEYLEDEPDIERLRAVARAALALAESTSSTVGQLAMTVASLCVSTLALANATGHAELGDGSGIDFPD